jgi:threonyl-tRNA synthetase
MDYCLEVEKALKTAGIRSYIDERSEKIGKKIRDTEVKKIPYMLVIGEKEQNESLVSVRKQGEGDEGAVQITDFVQRIQEESRIE